jgi:CubicO group peptidase (beta-lactamase class C family)
MHLPPLPAALVAAAALMAAHAATAQPDSTRADAGLDRRVERHMGEAGIVGLGAAIIVDGRVAWTRGYGFADRERALPFTPDTVMNIASISKTVTGAALMHAVQAGALDLDQDINAYLPFQVVNPHVPDQPITLRQLATHTSGITDRAPVYLAAYHYGGDSPQPLGEFLRSYFVPGQPLYSQDNFLAVAPGSHREYSNIGAGLAGHIVELAVGATLDDYTRRHIFEPLRMDSTGWFLSDIPPARHSKLYMAQGGLTVPIPHYGLTTYPDGGVRTSVSDLSRFFLALLGDGEYQGARILARESAQEMLRFQYTQDRKPDNVNITGEDSVNAGIFWATKFDGTRIGHSGSDPGVMTMMLADPSRSFGVVVFANTSLCEEGGRHYGALVADLWAHAQALESGEAAGGQD